MALGLGRGLEALIPSKKPTRPQPVVQTATSNSGSEEVAIDKIVPNPLQPRKRFNLDRLQELADSLKEHGLLEPLVVSPGETSGSFVLVAGERRLRAAELAGLSKVPVTIRETDDQQKLELALVENIQRQNLNPLEEAKAIKKLMNDFSLSQNEAAKKVGRARSAVANSLRLLELVPEAQKALMNEEISFGHAKVLLSVGNEAKQVEILRKVKDLRVSVRETERMAKKSLSKLEPKEDLMRGQIHKATDALERQLSKKLGSKVQIVTAPKGGRIVIEYYSDDEKNRIADQLLGTEGERGDSAEEFSV